MNIRWGSLRLTEIVNKHIAYAELAKLRAEFEIPGEVGNLSIDMLFGDYLLEWLEITICRLAIAQHILLIRNSSKA